MDWVLFSSALLSATPARQFGVPVAGPAGDGVAWLPLVPHCDAPAISWSSLVTAMGRPVTR